MIDAQVQELVTAFRSGTHTDADSERITKLCVALALQHPAALGSLITICLQEHLDGGSDMDALLSFLPIEQWTSLVARAMEALERDRDNPTSLSILTYASLQAPQATHPYLKPLFCLSCERGGQWTACFREARWADVAFLVAHLSTATQASAPDIWRYASRALLETRLPQAFDSIVTQKAEDVAPFAEVGFAHTTQGFEQLYPSRPLHLAFLPQYLGSLVGTDNELNFRAVHPTWHLASSRDYVYRFGGGSQTRCGVCGDTTDHLITLDPVPQHLGIAGLARLELVSCLSCLGWERESLYYAHANNGSPTDLNAYENTQDTTPHPPQFPSPSLLETTVALADLGPRWTWQDWLASHARENLHRLGGYPTWVQPARYATYPACVRCGQQTHFLLQLDSGLPLSDAGRTGALWGSGGVCYVFWCDLCKISQLSLQWT